MITPPLLLRLKDAWRVINGKSLKHTVRSQVTQSDSVASDWSLSPSDIEMLFNSTCAASLSNAPIVIVGARDPKVIYAIASWKNRHQKLKIILERSDLATSSPVQSVLHTLAIDDSIDVHEIDDSFSFISSISESPSIVLLNQELKACEVEKRIDAAKSVGCDVFLGYGYGIRYYETMQVIHKNLHVDVADNLWEIQLGIKSTLSLSEQNNDRANCTRDPELRVTGGLVSIVIPAYESRPYIDEAFSDIALQTYKNWELIVVEDASPDSIEDLVTKFREQVPNNKVVFHRKQTNSGASATRNVAMDLARGDYIAFLDSDDRWLPNHLSSKVELLNLSRADIAYSSVDMFDSNSGESDFVWGPSAEELECFPNSLFARNLIQPSGVVMRSSVVDDVGCFDESIFLVEDYDYWLRSVRMNKSFIHDPRVTSRYRKNHASASTTGRMVLCYDGIARVAHKNGDLLRDEGFRKYIVTKHLVTAGLGHLGCKQTEHNRCSPQIGYELLETACKIDDSLWGGKRWRTLAKLAISSGSVSICRLVFRIQYRKTRNAPLNYIPCNKAA